jgi:hypothetical protein
MDRCIEDENGCWVFLGAKSPGGYGVVGIATGRNGLTHRVTYEHFVGPVPDGLDLDHLCRNRACCNPWHLEPVTRLVNVNRGLRAKGSLNPTCRGGHTYTDETTGWNKRGRICRICERASSARKRQNRKAVAA